MHTLEFDSVLRESDLFLERIHPPRKNCSTFAMDHAIKIGPDSQRRVHGDPSYS